MSGYRHANFGWFDPTLNESKKQTTLLNSIKAKTDANAKSILDLQKQMTDLQKQENDQSTELEKIKENSQKSTFKDE